MQRCRRQPQLSQPRATGHPGKPITTGLYSHRYTVEAGPSLVATLDKFRKKRNIGGYERAGVVSEQEAQEMLVLARRPRNEVKDWLHVHHPELMRG
jgi:hypothetical protein